MPFVKTNMIEEAKELQELFKADMKAVKEFKEFEFSHLEDEFLKIEEQELKNKLIEIRKAQNITQKELEVKTGLTQQAISRFETGSGASFKTILKYAKGIDCKLVPQVNK